MLHVMTYHISCFCSFRYLLALCLPPFQPMPFACLERIGSTLYLPLYSPSLLFTTLFTLSHGAIEIRLPTRPSLPSRLVLFGSASLRWRWGRSSVLFYCYQECGLFMHVCYLLFPSECV